MITPADVTPPVDPDEMEERIEWFLDAMFEDPERGGYFDEGP